MDRTTWIQKQDEVVCISQSSNTLEKGIDPTILSLDVGKL